MPTYKTPGVYTEEISTLPQSVAEVATAIPAFIGYTEWAKDGDEDLLNKPTRINNLLDYRTMFGGPPATKFKVTIKADDKGNPEVETIENQDGPKPRFLMYHSLSLFFKNGGGSCYIVSVGDYSQPLDKKNFQAGLDALRKEDEPTLILLTDAVNMNEDDYYELCQASLKQCSDLKDRFAIFDVLSSDDDGRGKIGEKFRGKIVGDLKYSAAYYPYLQTSLNHFYIERNVDLEGYYAPVADLVEDCLWVQYSRPRITPLPRVNIIEADGVTDPKFSIDESTNTLIITISKGGESVNKIASSWQSSGPIGNFRVSRTSFLQRGTTEMSCIPKFEIDDLRVRYTGPETEAKVEIKISGKNIEFKIQANKLTITIPEVGALTENIVDQWTKLPDKGKFIVASFHSRAKVNAFTEPKELKYYDCDYLSHPGIKFEQTALYNKIKTELAKQRVVLPPSPAIAGVYARVDRTRGVWNAPANEGLMAVIKPVVKITQDDQENLNIDTTAGKSINAIRSFVGKGTLVWGARTLAGNDNEWRYISIRRLFNMIEESIQKSTAWVVFGPNNAMAWLKVKAMIESYLEGLWRAGALVGSTRDQAFFAHVGLGVTMTQQDILEGRMIIEVGIATVRPAEFIIIRFSHKMQEA